MSAMRSPTKLPSPIAGAKRWAKDRSGRSSKRRSLPRGWHNWALGALCLLVVVLAITSVGSSSADSAAEQRTATVKRGVVQSTVSGNGSLEAAQQVELNFGASGEVTEIDVEAGQKVSKGEVLARIDSSSARASLGSAEAQLSEAEETLEAATEGEEVSASYEGGASTVLASYERSSPPRRAPRKRGRSRRRQTLGRRAAPKKARAPTKKPSKPEEETSEPNEESGKKGEQEPANTEPKAAPNRKKHQAPRRPNRAAKRHRAKRNPAPQPGRDRQRRHRRSEAAPGAPQRRERPPGSPRNRAAGTDLRHHRLRLGLGGRNGQRRRLGGDGRFERRTSGGGGIGGLGAVGGSSSSSSSGSGSSSAFIVLSQLGRLKMEVSFSESDIGKIKVGQPATVAVSSMEGTELAGRVIKVDVLPSEGSSSGVVEYPATITLTQSAKGVRAGMSASAEVVVEQVGNALSVTSEAISSGPGGGSVTVLEDGKEVQRSVTTGLKGDETTQVLSGLKAGETVVLPEITAAAGAEGAEWPRRRRRLPRRGKPSELRRGGGPPGGFPGAP